MSRTTIILAIAFTAILCTVYFFIDPSEFPFTPRCMFHELTGLKCPGCGSQRMLHALVHGDISEAWHQNALLMVAIPVLIPLGWLEATRKRHPRLYMKVYSVRNIIIVSAVIVAWFIGRNLLD